MGEGKKSLSQDASSAATLIGLITLLLVGYIVFLPPQVRVDLLGEEKSTISTNGVDKVIPEDSLLLKEAIGHLSVVKQNEKEIKFPNFVLENTQTDIPIREIDSFQIYNGWLSELRKQIPFTIPKKGVKKVYVSFQAPLRNGVLVVGLNGVEVFRGYMDGPNELIPLQISELKMGRNDLTFHVEGSLLENQEFQIDDLKIIATVEDKEASIAHNPFSLDASSFESLKEGKLKFFVSCEVNNVGYLSVSLNNEQLYSSIPVCDDIIELNVYKEQLKKGMNVLSFQLSEGIIDVSRAELKLKLKETASFLSYFNINNQLYSDAVLDKFKKIILELDFVDDNSLKNLKLNINGFAKSIRQKESSFKWVLNEQEELLLPGRNYVEITPIEPVDIVELRILVE